MSLLFTSLMPLNKYLKGYQTKFSQNSLFIFELCTLKSIFLIKSRRRRAFQRNSYNVTFHVALSHTALAQWRKVIASSSLEPLSHPKVIALSKFEPLSLLTFIALDS
jgi:hypothetical protein